MVKDCHVFGAASVKSVDTPVRSDEMNGEPVAADNNESSVKTKAEATQQQRLNGSAGDVGQLLLSYSSHYTVIVLHVAWWLSGYGIGFGTERSRVRLPGAAFPSKRSTQPSIPPG